MFAGVRKPEDGQSLQADASNRLSPIIIDVADGDSIQDAAAKITAETRGELSGLVNNAGVTYQGPLEYLPLDDLRTQFEVNVIGQIATTQALLPIIREGRGRIVFMSSIGGRTKALPLLGPYAASKHAIEALADALRVELRPWGIHVALVEPGNIATPIWDKGDAALDGLITSLPAEGQKRYRTPLERSRKIAVAMGKRGIPPERVARRVAHALESPRPRTRYLVGIDAHVQSRLDGAIPTRVRDALMARFVGGSKD